jgi:hypothetical protein
MLARRILPRALVALLFLAACRRVSTSGDALGR